MKCESQTTEIIIKPHALWHLQVRTKQLKTWDSTFVFFHLNEGVFLFIFVMYISSAKFEKYVHNSSTDILYSIFLFFNQYCNCFFSFPSSNCCLVNSLSFKLQNWWRHYFPNLYNTKKSILLKLVITKG